MDTPNKSKGVSKGIIVQKYGGSSVADIDKIGLVADKVARARREGFDLCVVVSAMGKTTDSLLSLARSVSSGAGESNNPPRRELDMLLSTGERVTMSLLSIALQARGVPAISFTGSQSGIITNDRHFDARIIEVRPHRIEDELARGNVVIVAGYQGMSYKREITTLGRGGSDTTAVALAAALQAKRCEIYSDVDGVYSADPRVVPEASHLPEIGYDQLSEMAEAGAKVLNAQALEWARNNRVILHARRTADEQGRETVTYEIPPTAASSVTAVVGFDNNVMIAGNAQTLFAWARESGVALYDVEAQGDRATALLALLNVPDFRADAVRALGLTVTMDVGLVSIVGSSLVGAAFDQVTKLVPQALRITANPLRISLVLPRAELDATTQLLHQTLT
jgi:aspartate kinase